MENTIAPPAQQNTSVVAFRLDQRTFALPLDVIMQILPMMTITPIPHLSKIVMGTINIRGEDVLVINLRTHFNMEEVDQQLYTPLLLLKLKDRLLALVVDAVLDVMNLSLEKVTTLQDMLPEGIDNIPLMQGIAYHNDDTILVLDPDHLFYNQNTVTQQPIESRTSAIAEPPVVENIPVTKSSLAAKRKSVAKSARVAISEPIEEDMPVGESASVMENAPVEENMPVPISSPEDSPAEDE